MLPRLPVLFLAAVMLACPACVAPGYVNIPSQGGIAGSSPNSENVREVMAGAVAAAVEREPLEGPYEVLLPDRATQATYQDVVRRIGGGAVAPDTLRDGVIPSVQVVAVRIRSGKAECDLIRPSPTGRGVVRVFLRFYTGGDWGVERVTPLRISPEDLLLQGAVSETAPAPVPAGAGGAA